jgi:hypothetical protein
VHNKFYALHKIPGLLIRRMEYHVLEQAHGRCV